MVRFVIELDETYNGDPSFFQGHGHAFAEENLVACLPVGFPIDYRETVSDIIDILEEELRASDYVPINEDLFKQYEDEIRNLTEEDFVKAFKDALEDGIRMDDDFFEPIEEIETDEDDIYELPMFYCYFHIYLEDN